MKHTEEQTGWVYSWCFSDEAEEHLKLSAVHQIYVYIEKYFWVLKKKKKWNNIYRENFYLQGTK